MPRAASSGPLRAFLVFQNALDSFFCHYLYSGVRFERLSTFPVSPASSVPSTSRVTIILSNRDPRSRFEMDLSFQGKGRDRQLSRLRGGLRGRGDGSGRAGFSPRGRRGLGGIVWPVASLVLGRFSFVFTDHRLSLNLRAGSFREAVVFHFRATHENRFVVLDHSKRGKAPA